MVSQMPHDDPVLILSTFAEESQAAGVIRTLLGEGLIACGSLLPGVLSIYRWQGKVEESREVQVILKTTGRVRDRCMERLAALHPYEVPEIVAVDPSAVAGPYASWVRNALGSENL
jgi:periplasmic divalent cation tolerance protein